jgi:hypothetical protein
MSTVIVFLNIIHETVFIYVKHNVSETGSYRQVEPILLGLIHRALVPIFRHQKQHKTGYVKQTQNKPSARVNTNIRIIEKPTHKT